MPMPRKLPSSTKLAKYERCTIHAPAHRIATNSTNSMRKLAATSSTRSRRTVEEASGGRPERPARASSSSARLSIDPIDEVEPALRSVQRLLPDRHPDPLGHAA